VLGELITLLEDDKRLGGENQMTVTLPYSNTLFGVPANLHVIGTMNTADRSIEALDAALRRRFEFREMPPRPEDLKFVIDGPIDPHRMLRTINRRLEKLRDRDHCIGDAYFRPLENDRTLDALKQVFANKILPLLQEYFFGDWGKIGLVLGKEFVRRKADNIELANFDHDDRETLMSRTVYELTPISELTDHSFRRIYEDVPADA
jgi:5-methylcytosine-specific restriction protein B